jgi:hypothetical protein
MGPYRNGARRDKAHATGSNDAQHGGVVQWQLVASLEVRLHYRLRLRRARLMGSLRRQP